MACLQHLPHSGQEALAQRLVDASFADCVFFANTGTEAVECAIKTARRYHHVNGQPERIDIVGFAGSFHGRTYAAINASGNAGYMEAAAPRLPGFVHCRSMTRRRSRPAIASPTTAAVIVEPCRRRRCARAARRMAAPPA